MYVADTGNNRVLAFRDARNLKVGDLPDLVVGQVDFNHNSVNYTSGDPNQPNERGLFFPSGVAVDPDGNLWVADTGNSRVIRFPRPFDQSPGDFRGNLCLGQVSCNTTPQLEPTARTMRAPFGIAFLYAGPVLVSDISSNRVLMYRKPEGGDFTNGQAAVLAIGQRDLNSGTSGVDPDKLFSPRYLTVDTSDRVYIADSGNNRIFITQSAFSNRTSSGLQAAYALQMTSTPTGVAVSRTTGNIWVTLPSVPQLLRFPEYLSFALLATPPSADVIPTYGPISLALDPQDNPVVVEAANRVSFFYARIDVQNGASLNRRLIAPDMVTKLSPVADVFGDVSGTAPSDTEWPTDLGDIEVLVDGKAAPIKSVSFESIWIQMPSTLTPPLPTEIVVRQKSTGQVIGAIVLPTEQVSPGFFTTNGIGTGQIVALNEDGSANGAGNGAARGSTIKLFGTGIGIVPGGPSDGTAPTGDVPAPEKPAVAIGNAIITPANIKYFGLAPGMIGTFRLDVVVPANAAVNQANLVGLQYKDFFSKDGLPTNNLPSIWVK